MHPEKPDHDISYFTHDSFIDPVILGDFPTFFPGMREYCIRQNIVSAAKRSVKQSWPLAVISARRIEFEENLVAVCGKLEANESKLSAAG
jgi:hypothetical protein